MLNVSEAMTAGAVRGYFEKFSPRRATIQAEKDRLSKLLKIDDPEEMVRAAKKLGITEPWRIELLHEARKRGLEAAIQAAGAKLTRRHKQKDLDQGELWRIWERMLSDDDRAALDGAKGQRGWVTTDADAARYVVEHVFHGRSVVKEKKLLAEGLRYGVGSVTLGGLKQELIRHGVVFENGEATTRELGRQEDAIAAFAREGSRLEKSPLNARRTAGKVGMDELKASLLAHGLMQNLVVTDAGDGAYRVIAGGRRLEAIRSLQAEGKLPEDFAVPCQIVSEEHALEMSLAENTVRLAMHPADQFEAFAALIDKGETAAEVARRFGVEETTVLLPDDY